MGKTDGGWTKCNSNQCCWKHVGIKESAEGHPLPDAELQLQADRTNVPLHLTLSHSTSCNWKLPKARAIWNYHFEGIGMCKGNRQVCNASPNIRHPRQVLHLSLWHLTPCLTSKPTWMFVRPHFAKPEVDTLFVTKEGVSFQPGTIGKCISRWWKQATGHDISSTALKKVGSTETMNEDLETQKAFQTVMTHRQTTAEQHYQILNRMKQVVKGHGALAKIL